MSSCYMSELTPSFGAASLETRIFQEKPHAFNPSIHEYLCISEVGDVLWEGCEITILVHKLVNARNTQIGSTPGWLEIHNWLMGDHSHFEYAQLQFSRKFRKARGFIDLSSMGGLLKQTAASGTTLGSLFTLRSRLGFGADSAGVTSPPFNWS